MPYMEAGWRFGMQEICNREIIYPLAPVEVIPDQQYFDVAKIHKHVCAFQPATYGHTMHRCPG